MSDYTTANNTSLTLEKLNTEPVMTIHPDGRVTVTDKLKPNEAAAKVVEAFKTRWMADVQATKIREQQDCIKRLEEAGDKLEYASVISEAGEDPNGFEKLLIAQREWRKAKEAKP